MDLDIEALYGELRRIAGRHFRQSGAMLTLQPTLIVHEAYLRLPSEGWQSKTHFLATASRVMRNVVVDHIRARTARKRDGGRQRVTLSLAGTAANETTPLIDVLALEEVLNELEKLDPRKARVVEMRCYGGLEIAEIAAALGAGTATVKRDWEFARTWLYRELTRGPHDAG
ncbi:MAG: sigma-70 family RNA polymerase sigma factor [Bryobacterales bacterium]|nr:sigma-70 family RNA polymerase sigma factor [Bryobacterales bacterium]